MNEYEHQNKTGNQKLNKSKTNKKTLDISLNNKPLAQSFDSKFDLVNFFKKKESEETIEMSLNSVKKDKILKNNLTKTKKIWISKPKTSQEISQKNEENLIKLLSPAKDQCLESPFKCDNFTLSLLSSLSNTHSIQIPVPETIINGFGFTSPVFIYNDPKGNLSFLHRQNLQSFRLVSKIFALKQQVNDLNIGPVAIRRLYCSDDNRVYMREKDLENEFQSNSKSDFLIQRYILQKGSICSKFRLVYRNEATKVYSIINRNAYNKSSFTKKKTEKASRELNINFSVPQSQLILKYTQSILNSYLGSKKKEPLLASPLDDFEKFIESIKPSNETTNLEEIYSELLKNQENEEDWISNNSFSVNLSANFYRELRKIFCVYTKNNFNSYITELKSLKRCEKIISLFNYLKDTINLYELREKNLKISEFICDFFEDSHKNLYLSKIKSCQCEKSFFVALKKVMKIKTHEKKFSCPGKFCKDLLGHEKLDTEDSKLFRVKVKLKFLVFKGEIDEKFQTLGNLDKLHPRLFQQVQVCEKCFKGYNRSSEKYIKKLSSIEVKKTDDSEKIFKEFIKRNTKDFADSEVSVSIKTSKEPAYYAGIGKKFLISTQNNISKILKSRAGVPSKSSVLESLNTQNKK